MSTSTLHASDLSNAEDFLRMIAVFDSAHEIGVFACLERGVSEFCAIQQQVQAHPSTLLQLLDCLVSFGIVRAGHGSYTLEPVWARAAWGNGARETVAGLRSGVSALDR